MTETAEPRRVRGCPPYSTSTPDHCRTVSEVANYEFTQPLQAQPHAFFAHGQGQRYGAYGKVVHRRRVLHGAARYNNTYNTSPCGLCVCRCLSGILQRWKTRRWEDTLSCLLNTFIILARCRLTKTDHLDTLAPRAKLEINCIAHHVSNCF